MARGAGLHPEVRGLAGLRRGGDAPRKRDAVGLVDRPVIRGERGLHGRVLAERVADLLDGVAEVAPLARGRLRAEARELGLERGEALSPRVEVGGRDRAVPLPVGDPEVELVDAARELRPLLRLAEPPAVGEGEGAPPHVEVDRADGLEVVRGLGDEDCAHLLARRRWRVGVTPGRRGTDDNGRQVGHGIGDALGLAPAHGGERDDDVRAVRARRLRRCAHGLGRRDGRAPDAIDAADTDERDPHAVGRDDPRRQERRPGVRVEVRQQPRRAARPREPPELRAPGGPVVAGRSPAREPEVLERGRERLGLRDVLRTVVPLEHGVHEERRPGRDQQARRSVGALRVDPRSRVVEPAELVLHAPARLDGPGEIGKEVDAECRRRLGPGRRRRAARRRRVAAVARREAERDQRARERRVEPAGPEARARRAFAAALLAPSHGRGPA